MSDDPALTPPDERRVARITAAEAGKDPLVARYLACHRKRCAYQVWSWWWLIVTFPLLILAGTWMCSHLGAFLEAPDWVENVAWLSWAHARIGNPLGFLVGLGIGTAALSLLGLLVRPGGVAGGQEPWIAAIPLVFAYLTFIDPKAALSTLTACVCIVYLFTLLFRLEALLWARRRRHLWIVALGYAASFAWAAFNRDRLGADAWWWGLGIGLPATHFLHACILFALRQGREFVELGPEPEEWPIYTVLVPLYKEAGVADKILRHLRDLDYPKDRLDVKFLLEADDPTTREALEAEGIPEWAEAVVVPDAHPKTKPRACNYGLERARGEFLVIFDAEDRPEPDQLKLAVRGFATSDEKVVCLQAQLAYHNHDQNLLTRWFALEYNVWFRRYLPGLTALGGPIPLGGTSNHFRTAALHRLGGWDPFNVTEDCDLGIRLAAAGHRTEILDSVTWEEANSRIGNWLRQRSRWMKGYMITHVVWFRNPLALIWRLGPFGALRFCYSVIGVAGLALLNLPLWIALGTYCVLLAMDVRAGWNLWELLTTPPASGDDRHSWAMAYLGPYQDFTWSRLSLVFAAASAVLLFANAVFVVLNCAFGTRPGQRGLAFAALLTPFYWILISLGAWKGAFQLLLRPHYWEKTVHGLDRSTGGAAPPPVPARETG